MRLTRIVQDVIDNDQEYILLRHSRAVAAIVPFSRVRELHSGIAINLEELEEL